MNDYTGDIDSDSSTESQIRQRWNNGAQISSRALNKCSPLIIWQNLRDIHDQTIQNDKYAQYHHGDRPVQQLPEAQPAPSRARAAPNAPSRAQAASNAPVQAQMVGNLNFDWENAILDNEESSAANAPESDEKFSFSDFFDQVANDDWNDCEFPNEERNNREVDAEAEWDKLPGRQYWYDNKGKSTVRKYGKNILKLITEWSKYRDFDINRVNESHIRLHDSRALRYSMSMRKYNSVLGFHEMESKINYETVNVNELVQKRDKTKLINLVSILRTRRNLLEFLGLKRVDMDISGQAKAMMADTTVVKLEKVR